MGRNSLLGVEKAPLEAPGRDEGSLGPSDSSDSASDRAGTEALTPADPAEPVDVTLGRDVEHAALDAEPPRGRGDGADISVDRIFDADEQLLPGVDKPQAIDPAMKRTVPMTKTPAAMSTVTPTATTVPILMATRAPSPARTTPVR